MKVAPPYMAKLKKPFRYENELRDLVKKLSEVNLKMEFKEELKAEKVNQNSDESLKTNGKHRSKSKGLKLDFKISRFDYN